MRASKAAGTLDKPRANPGAVLRAYRRQNGWTLAEVSERTGLQVSTLSKVENSKMSLSYDKLVRISQGLKIDIALLFGGGQPQSEPQVARAALSSKGGALNGRRSITPAGGGKHIQTANYLHLYPASDLLNKKFSPVIADLQVRKVEDFGEFISHPGEEYAYVLEGEVDLYTTLYAPLRLKTGDSIYFDSGMGHAYIAAAPGRCRVLSVCMDAEPAGPPARKR